MNRFAELGVSAVLLAGCGGTNQPASVGGGGSNNGGGLTSIGGSNATGGVAAPSGGSNSAGGVVSIGGSNATGGNSSAVGGTSATGGANSTGGALSTGGSKPTGGSASLGGTNSTGGSASTGGTKSTGGSASLGGTNSTGGSASTGGTKSTGGSASTGGTKSTGGSASTGGVTATGGNPGTGGTSALSSLLVPAQGALLGAFVGTGTFDQLETTLGRKLAIIHTFVGWSDDWTTRLAGDVAGGRIPLITWETWNNSVGVPLDDIISGVHDSMIASRAQAAKNLGSKFFLRWGHEMNGNWYPWDGYHNGANSAASAKYIATYKHIHDLFVSAGATNVLWIFCPNVDSVPGDSWNQWSNYYPGDSYVDWMGFDGYNWGTSQSTSTWQSFTTIAGRIYSSISAKNKPIIIPETASSELGGDKAAYIGAIVPALKGSFPNIKALVWFHMNKETDWRLDSSATAATAAISMAKDPYFNP
jgi:hypothetical protein